MAKTVETSALTNQVASKFAELIGIDNITVKGNTIKLTLDGFENPIAVSPRESGVTERAMKTIEVVDAMSFVKGYIKATGDLTASGYSKWVKDNGLVDYPTVGVIKNSCNGEWIGNKALAEMLQSI